MRPVVPIFMNVCVCVCVSNVLLFQQRMMLNPESHLLCSNDLMISQGTAKDAKYSRSCLTSSGDACLWYKSVTPVGNY